MLFPKYLALLRISRLSHAAAHSPYAAAPARPDHDCPKRISTFPPPVSPRRSTMTATRHEHAARATHAQSAGSHRTHASTAPSRPAPPPRPTAARTPPGTPTETSADPTQSARSLPRSSHSDPHTRQQTCLTTILATGVQRLFTLENGCLDPELGGVERGLTRL